MEQSGTSALLQGAVQDLSSDVVSVLRGEGHVRLPDAVVDGPGAGVTAAAVRVLGADLLLPHVLTRTPPLPDTLEAFRQAVRAFPPRSGAAPAVEWSHWAMRRTLHRFDPAGTHAEPGADRLGDATWQSLTHQLAVLAPLAVPGEDCAVARAARGRPVDLARGFVRAVRRRDWLQAAGTGRWLTLLDGVPDTLGLESGLDFVDLMGGSDPRVALQLAAARATRRAGAPV